jgi:small nuclear ribonucleoprotein E
MSHRQGGGRNKVLLPPINFIFKLLQQHSTVQIWLFEQLGMRIEGKIRGFDEFMNLVIDDAVEVKQSTKLDPNPQDGPNGGRRHLGMFISEPKMECCKILELTRRTGQILLKGDNVALIQALE